MSELPPIPSHTDTLVVGCGPAGVMAALHAAERGDVLLVDSSALPRDKSCGGMLNEYTQEFLAAYGELPSELYLDPQWVNFRYHDWDRKILKPTALRFANVDRAGFDDWLMSLLPENVTVVASDHDQRVRPGLRRSHRLPEAPRWRDRRGGVQQPRGL